MAMFPTFLFTKGKVHMFGMFGHVKDEDADVRFAKSPKGWTVDELGYHWLTEVYHPHSLQRIQPGGKRLLILDGHNPHANLRFCEFCDANGIIVFCLSPHSTHLLQTLDVGLFAPLQKHCGKAVEDYYLTTGAGIRHRQFLSLYKTARLQAFTQRNIEASFRKTGICPFNSRTVLASAINLRRTSGSATASVQIYLLDKSPYTKCQLRQQTHRAMTFVKTATEGEICNLLFRFFHAVEYNIASTEISATEMHRLHQEMKVAKATKKDQRGE